MASSTSDKSSPHSAKRPKQQCHFDTAWTQEFRGIKRSSKGNTFACCIFSNSDFSISHGGRNDVTAHVNGKRHKDIIQSSSSSKPVASFFSQPVLQQTISAEVRWALFVAKHNLAFLTSDNVSKMFSKMFPDSKIVSNFGCGRTKTTAIVKEALAPHYLEKTVQSMSNPFSLLMDESNDKTDKSCIILVRTLDEELGDTCTCLLDMPVVNVGTAANLFAALKLSLENHGLNFEKAVAFMSDTTNVMKGARSGVQKLISRENRALYDVGCICHLADLSVKAGMEALPVDIDQFFVDVFYYFCHSSKRKHEFEELWQSLLTSEPEVILKHSPTRWLSLLRCVDRYLKQMDGLISYFQSCREAESSKVLSIVHRLQNPMMRPLLLFLSHILPSMDRFSRVFQKSTENTTCELYTEMSRLVRLYAANLLNTSAIISAADDLSKLNLSEENQLSNESLGIGTNTWTYIFKLEEEEDIKPFFQSVRGFYQQSIQKMLKKFPFGDSLLKDLGILQPNRVHLYMFETVVKFAKRFPQLSLDDSQSIDCLREEFMDFLLSPGDLPPPVTYTAADRSKKPRAGKFWLEVSKLRTFDGRFRFGSPYHLMSGLLSIPCSNADSERGFSMLRKIHTDQRSNLDQSTIVALMSVKFNCDNCCFEVKFDDNLLAKCKKATYISLRK